MYTAMLRAAATVAVPTVTMCYLVAHGYFDTVFTENGEAHYAESYDKKWRKVFPPWLKMPFNCFVNIGYILVGALYCARTTVSQQRKEISDNDAYMFHVFNLMASTYGPIQALRILSQNHNFAVIDQWYTLPFFMWVFVWGLNIAHGWSSSRIFIWIPLSIASYLMSLLHQNGFEMALVCNICFAVAGAVISYKAYPTPKVKEPFIKALLSCSGFVILKLLDLELPKYNPIFKKISGHFLSKIADIMQIYYVNRYFETMLQHKLSIMNKKD